MSKTTVQSAKTKESNRRAFLSLGLGLALATPALALAWSENPATPEGWAWTQIQAGKAADFDKHCGVVLDPRKKSGWDDPCRRLSSDFLVDLVTRAKLKEQVPSIGIHLRSVHLIGDVDLAAAEINTAISVESSLISGNFSLEEAHLKHTLSLEQSTLDGTFDAAALKADAKLTADHAYFRGPVVLVAAAIGGDLDLGSASFAKNLAAYNMEVHGNLFMMDHAAFNGEVQLMQAKIGGALEMEGSSFLKNVDAENVDVHGAFFMENHATFHGDVNLLHAKAGSLELDSASFLKSLNAEDIDVRSNVFMRDHTAFNGNVSLRHAKIGADLQMQSSSFSKDLDLEDIAVGENVDMDDHATFGGEVIMRDARVGGNLDMTASTLSTLTADRIEVHGTLFMRQASFAGEVRLLAGRIGSNLELQGSSFAEALIADQIDVQGNVFMGEGASYDGLVSLSGAKVNVLDLRSATARSIDLSSASGRELRLAALRWRCLKNEGPDAKAPDDREDPHIWLLGYSFNELAACEAPAGSWPWLILRDARFDQLSDDAMCWPPTIELEGFRYGGSVAIGGDQVLRTNREWTNWLARNRIFSQQPYSQLAEVLLVSGRREEAEAVLYAGRERERDETWNRREINRWSWFRHDFWSWAWLSFLSGVAGYGIGLYTFRVLYWVVGLTVLGAMVLRASPSARQHNNAWRLGASLHRLLPIIELSKEFKDFFDDPEVTGTPLKLSSWQRAFFSAIALAGWILGFFLLAAMGGLLPK